MTDKQHDELQKQHELEQHEVRQVHDFLKHYGTMILLAVVAATATVIVSKTISMHKANMITEAETKLSSAKTPEELETVVQNYESTSAARTALLKLAKKHFNNGDYTAAQTEYERFVEQYKDDDMLPVANFGLAYCAEAQEKFDEAINRFKSFLADNPGHYLSAPATLSLARCQEEAGKTDEARITLEDFMAANEDSHWYGSAENQLQLISKQAFTGTITNRPGG